MMFELFLEKFNLELCRNALTQHTHIIISDVEKNFLRRCVLSLMMLKEPVYNSLLRDQTKAQRKL